MKSEQCIATHNHSLSRKIKAMSVIAIASKFVEPNINSIGRQLSTDHINFQHPSDASVLGSPCTPAPNCWDIIAVTRVIEKPLAFLLENTIIRL